MLSTREHEIFLLLAQGKKNKEIGKMLSISTRTVDTHRSNILKKLQMKSNAEMVKLAISEGFI
jgi:DNA-binding NarL/FixJ family response regulator